MKRICMISVVGALIVGCATTGFVDHHEHTGTSLVSKAVPPQVAKLDTLKLYTHLANPQARVRMDELRQIESILSKARSEVDSGLGGARYRDLGNALGVVTAAHASLLRADGADIGLKVLRPGKPFGSILKDMQVDLPEALRKNVFLRSYEIQELVLAALDTGGLSTSENGRIRQAIRGNVLPWVTMNERLMATTGFEERVEADVLSSEGSSQNAQPGVVSAENGDEAIEQALALSAEGQHAKAIALLTTISESAPTSGLAKEHIQNISNRAVQELRGLAAQAYQSSLPVMDAKAKENYLHQAQRYLSEAIENYPTARQLPKVKENLAVISRDLQALRSM